VAAANQFDQDQVNGQVPLGFRVSTLIVSPFTRVILAQTIKGYGLGEAGEGRNITHQQKKLNEKALQHFWSRFQIPMPDEAQGLEGLVRRNWCYGVEQFLEIFLEIFLLTRNGTGCKISPGTSRNFPMRQRRKVSP
jgi:hypothetical protein